MNKERIPSITELGDPSKPKGAAGAEMLTRMNESHKDVTAWGLSHIMLKGSENVLDIGCGGGAALARVAESITTGHLTGVDYSPVSVKLSSMNNAELIEQGKMEIVEGSVEELPFADDSFDFIYTVESFYFWKNTDKSLKEVRRVLRSGGHFLIIADVYGDAELSESSIRDIAKYDLFNPTKAEFSKLLSRAGFTEVRIHTKAGTSWICAESVK